MGRPQYEHTQHGWPMRIGLGSAATAFLVVTALEPPSQSQSESAGLIVGALLALALGWAWSTLTVRIQDGALHLRFGLGVPRKTVALADIASVEVTRTRFWNGWGVRRTRRGWLYNVSGFDAVLVRRTDGKTFLVGTAEPRKLKAALERALPAAATLPRQG